MNRVYRAVNHVVAHERSHSRKGSFAPYSINGLRTPPTTLMPKLRKPFASLALMMVAAGSIGSSGEM